METHSFRKVSSEPPKTHPNCGNCAFPQNVHIGKLGEFTAFYAVFLFFLSCVNSQKMQCECALEINAHLDEIIHL